MLPANAASQTVAGGHPHPITWRDGLMKMTNKVSFGLALLGLFCIVAVCTSRSHDESFTEEGLFETDASELKCTIVTPHLEAAVVPGEGILWCGSFQLAWNEACSLFGGGLRFGDEPTMVTVLNKRTFTRQYLDAESYVAVADLVENDVHRQIVQQLECTFAGEATPHYIPPEGLTPRPQDVVVYAYLYKNLEFQTPFERLAEPIVFGGSQVPCFGIGEEYKSKHFEMLKQLQILDYQNEDDFVIELRTKGVRDRVILAKVQPGTTLEATIEAVQNRAANSDPASPQIGDVLKVPKFNFDITRRYRELEGKKLLHTNPSLASDLVVGSAIQNVRFQFDEKGVRLRSESHVTFGCGGPPPPPPTRHIMVFDEPFLLLLQRVEADVPYFAVWVANPEVLVKVGE